MSREIKFRAWHTPEHKMYHWGSGLIAIDHQGNVETVPAGRILKRDDVVLMQFTGLKDQEGKEIYEGDIVDLELHQSNRKAQVVWSSCRWWFKMIDLDPDGRVRMDWLESKWESRCKIVGNIYENSDFLAIHN